MSMATEDLQIEAESVTNFGVVNDPITIDLPEETRPLCLVWPAVIVLASMHALAMLVIVPFFFTWSGVLVGVLGHFVFGMFGITVGYHRLLTHRGFVCPKWMEHFFAILGICTLQDSPARWVAIHRMHHQHSDHQPDPHSPLATFLWGHIGWMIYRHRGLDTTSHYERYVRDLLRDPFYLRLERYQGWFFVYVLHALFICIIGGIYGYWLGGFNESVRYFASWMVWGIAARTVFIWHGTWSVNSVAHVLGYRNYETRDNSRNHWLVALLTHGEGWHNNHHAQPRSARHGHRWWEFDMSWWVILFLEKIGLAQDVVRPKR